MNASIKTKIDQIASQPGLTAEETDALMAEAFALATTAEERKEAGKYLSAAISRRKRPDIDAKALMGDAVDALNLSHIARRYFNKDKTWLYQRMNKSVVNGTPAAFTESELKTLSDSLREIGHSLIQTSFNLTHQSS